MSSCTFAVVLLVTMFHERVYINPCHISSIETKDCNLAEGCSDIRMDGGFKTTVIGEPKAVVESIKSQLGK